VGGIYETPKTADQAGVVYEPAPAQMQRDAVQWLHKNLFETPTWLLDPKVLPLIRPDQGVSSITNLQSQTLDRLLANDRLQRMVEIRSTNPNAYGVDQLFGELSGGIFAEIVKGQAITVHRRNLQKAFLEKNIAMAMANDAESKRSDAMSVARGNLNALLRDLKNGLVRSPDRMSRLHIEDCIARLEKALDLEKKRG
jgi:hypothetical protein